MSALACTVFGWAMVALGMLETHSGDRVGAHWPPTPPAPFAWCEPYRAEPGGRMRYYDRQGESMTMAQWVARLEGDTDGSYRVVRQTDLPDGSILSTIWLGLDHNWMPGGRRLIFETMRFGSDFFPDPWGDGESSQVRYSSEEEAIEGHGRILAGLERIRDGGKGAGA